MRAVLHSDLSAAARALLAAPELSRDVMAVEMVQQADIANRYTRRFGRPHPEFGNGTLAETARKNSLAAEPTIDDLEYCECLTLILESLAARRAAAPCQ